MEPHATPACSWRKRRASAQIGTSTVRTLSKPLPSSARATSTSDDVHELAAAAAELAGSETPERVMRFAQLLRSRDLSAESPAGALQDHLAVPSARLPRYVNVLKAFQSAS